MPPQRTQALASYLADVEALSGLGSYFFERITEDVSKVADAAQAAGDTLSLDLRARVLSVHEDMSRWHTLVVELAFIRYMDQYLTYVTELLTAVFVAKPNMLKSKRTMTYEDILECATMPELVGVMVERRVLDLAYKNIEDLADVLAIDYNLALFNSPEEQRKIHTWSEVRNIFTHAHGIATPRFINRVSPTKYLPGQAIVLSAAEVGEAGETLKQSAIALDARAIAKFQLPMVPS